MNALRVRFGLTRVQAEKVRAAIADEHGQGPAELNGHQLEEAGTHDGSSQ
jgi:hypothetical protein